MHARAKPPAGQALQPSVPMLVVTQMAFSLLLLVAAGLFGRTLSTLHAIELGFNRDHVLLFTIRPSTVGYEGPALRATVRGAAGAPAASCPASAT